MGSSRETDTGLRELGSEIGGKHGVVLKFEAKKAAISS